MREHWYGCVHSNCYILRYKIVTVFPVMQVPPTTRFQTATKLLFFRAGENAIVVNENLTIPPWAFCIYIPFGRDAGLIVVGIGKVIAAYRMNSTWTYRYDIK